jgi:hypothetical protein
MLIYLICNLAQEKTDYVCDSQETIDAAPSYAKPTCTIGGEPEANTILANNQQALLTQKTDLFTVNLQTAVEGGVVWTIVNLSTEPENTDRQYFVLDPTTGLYTEAIGLDAAKALFAQTQQTYLVFTKMNIYTTMTSWE